MLQGQRVPAGGALEAGHARDLAQVTTAGGAGLRDHACEDAAVVLQQCVGLARLNQLALVQHKNPVGCDVNTSTGQQGGRTHEESV